MKTKKTRKRKMTKRQMVMALQQMDACSRAMEWVRSRRERTAEEIWAACQNLDWLIWVIDFNDTFAEKRRLYETTDVICLRLGQGWRSVAFYRGGADRWVHLSNEQDVNAAKVEVDIFDMWDARRLFLVKGNFPFAKVEPIFRRALNAVERRRR